MAFLVLMQKLVRMKATLLTISLTKVKKIDLKPLNKHF